MCLNFTILFLCYVFVVLCICYLLGYCQWYLFVFICLIFLIACYSVPKKKLFAGCSNESEEVTEKTS
jgi:hypothetical protein